MSKLKLSNSGVDTFFTCQEKWNLHYNLKIRPENTSSALHLGGCLDRSLNCLLLQKKKNLLDSELEESKLSYLEVFDDHFKNAEVNGTTFDIRISDKIKYYKNDLDVELLEEEDYLAIQQMEMEDLIRLYKPDVAKFVDECRQKLAAKLKLKGDVLRMYNYISWLSLRRKGHMMLKAWEADIFPHIVEVLGVQKTIQVESEEGIVRGVIDFIAKFDDGITYIVDNKSSTGFYDESAIINSQQLAIYSELTGIKDVAYAVMDKTLRKKEPRCRTQLLKGQVPEAMIEIVFTRIGTTIEKIKKGEFEKNLKSCFNYGGCPYLGYCKSGNVEGLVKLPVDEKK
jgi:hypothetical protein